MKTYEKPRIIPMSDFDGNEQTPTGLPVTVFILVAGLSVIMVSFVVNVGVGWSIAVGTSRVVSTTTYTKN